MNAVGERRERSLSGGVNAATDVDTAPLTLALVHLPVQEENRRFLILVGSGAPEEWQLPPSATLVSSP